MNKELPKSHNQNGVTVHQHSAGFYSGPLPPPEVLKRFDEIVPGSAERIITMAEEQSIHRKNLEKQVIYSDISRSKWGQILGFVIAIVGLGVSGVVAIYGNAIAGSIIGVGTLASLVSVFMYGSKSRVEEREAQKPQEL